MIWLAFLSLNIQQQIEPQPFWDLSCIRLRLQAFNTCVSSQARGGTLIRWYLLKTHKILYVQPLTQLSKFESKLLIYQLKRLSAFVRFRIIPKNVTIMGKRSKVGSIGSTTAFGPRDPRTNPAQGQISMNQFYELTRPKDAFWTIL